MDDEPVLLDGSLDKSLEHENNVFFFWVSPQFSTLSDQLSAKQVGPQARS